MAAVVALAALVASAPNAMADEPTQSVSFTAWTWNVAGHKMNKGSTDNGLVAEAVQSIKRAENGVDFASFNELCYSQYQKIRSELADWNPANGNYARFQEAIPAGSRDTAGHEICQGGAFGKAVFSRYELGKAEYRVFAQESGHTYKSEDGAAHPVPSGLLCAPLAAYPNMKFCSVHITPVSTTAQPFGYRQLVELQTLLDGFAKAEDPADDQTYMVAGDFNAQPDYPRLDRFYDAALNTTPNSKNLGNRGGHRELDDTDTRCVGYGEPTVDSTEGADVPPCGDKPKIDMIFVRTDQLASADYSADTKSIPTCREVDSLGREIKDTSQPCSDHRVLMGHATLKIKVKTPTG
ncbi:endonuclease/exonuclease/phosphatase family protein [Streptomyces sp. 12297]